MNTPTEPSSMWARSTTRRVLLWLCTWRALRKLLFTGAVLATLVALAYAVENMRGKRAWESYRRDLEARGEKLDLQAFVPPQVPDEQNFAMTPFLAPLFDFVPDSERTRSPWRDTNAFARTSGFTKDLPSRPDKFFWREGRKLNLAEWLEAFQEKKSPPATVKNDSAVASSSRDPKAAAASVLEALRPYEPTLEELRAASRRPHARFNLRYDQENPAAILLPHLAVIRGACQVLRVRALAALTLGEPNKAFDDVLLMFYLADSLKDEPLLISHLVRLTNFQMALQAVWEGLADRRWSETQLAQLQSRLGQFNLLQDFRRVLRSERAFGIKIADLVRQSPNRALELDRLGWEPADQPHRDAEWLLLNLIPRGVFYFETLNYARLFEETILGDNAFASNRVNPSLVDKNGERLDAVCQHRGRAIWNHHVLSGMMLPALRNVFPKAAYGQTAANEAVIACALERHHLAHGSYPERLESLAPRFIETMPADVITGKPLAYRRTEKGRFLLYSVGWNETDDGGICPSDLSKGDPPPADQSRPKRPGRARQATFNLEKGDWVWRYQAG